MLSALASLGAAIWLVVVIPNGIFSKQDNGLLMGGIWLTKAPLFS